MNERTHTNGGALAYCPTCGCVVLLVEIYGGKPHEHATRWIYLRPGREGLVIGDKRP
jgi:hypothetical protein